MLVVIQNSYAAATVRVEAEQTVVTTGLYGLVRHPMYVGALIMMIGTPLALDSYWGLVTIVPALVALGLPHQTTRRRCSRMSSSAIASTRRRCTTDWYGVCGEDGMPAIRRGTLRRP